VSCGNNHVRHLEHQLQRYDKNLYRKRGIPQRKNCPKNDVVERSREARSTTSHHALRRVLRCSLAYVTYVKETVHNAVRATPALSCCEYGLDIVYNHRTGEVEKLRLPEPLSGKEARKGVKREEKDMVKGEWVYSLSSERAYHIGKYAFMSISRMALFHRDCLVSS